MFGFFKRFTETPIIKSEKTLRLEYIQELESQAQKIVEAKQNQYSTLFTDFEVKYLAAFFSYNSYYNLHNPLLNNNYETVEVTNDERIQLIENHIEILKSLECPPNMIEITKKLYLAKKYSAYERLKNVSSVLLKYDLSYSKMSMIENEVKEFENVVKEALAYLEKEAAIIGSGMHGENRVNKELDMYDYMWTNLTNVRFEVDGESVESDNILVTTKGIYTIEVKNYAPKGQYSLVITKDGQWLKVFGNGKREPINNVTAQVNRHIAYKQKLINMAWISKYGRLDKPLLVEPIFVLGNEKVQVQNDTDLPIMRASSIYHYLKDKPDIFTQEQVNLLVSIIREHNLPPKKYEYMNYVDTIQNKLNQIEEYSTNIIRLYPFYYDLLSTIKSKVNTINTSETYKDIATFPIIKTPSYGVLEAKVIQSIVEEMELFEADNILKGLIIDNYVGMTNPDVVNDKSKISKSKALSLIVEELNELKKYSPDTIKKLIKEHVFKVKASSDSYKKVSLYNIFLKKYNLDINSITSYSSSVTAYEKFYNDLISNHKKTLATTEPSEEIIEFISYLRLIKNVYSRLYNNAEAVNNHAELWIVFHDRIFTNLELAKRYGL